MWHEDPIARPEKPANNLLGRTLFIEKREQLYIHAMYCTPQKITQIQTNGNVVYYTPSDADIVVVTDKLEAAKKQLEQERIQM